MPDPNFQYTPSDGWNNGTTFPTNPAKETTRGLFQLLFDQARDAINALVAWANGKFATSAEIQGVVLGQIPDGTITPVKLSFDPATQTELDAKMDKAGGTFTNFVAHGRNEVRQPKIKDYSEVISTNATATGTVSLSIANGNVFDVTLTGNTTFTFDNPATTGQACSFTLVLRQGGTTRTVTWPSSIKWPNDVVPDVSDINKTAILTFITLDGGTRWYGFLAGNKLVT